MMNDTSQILTQIIYCKLPLTVLVQYRYQYSIFFGLTRGIGNLRMLFLPGTSGTLVRTQYHQGTYSRRGYYGIIFSNKFETNQLI